MATFKGSTVLLRPPGAAVAPTVEEACIVGSSQRASCLLFQHEPGCQDETTLVNN